MKKQMMIVTIAACTTLALAAFRGGCSPDPCPDLYIACPELECPDGFQVDKSGCAICECVGQQTLDCVSDADCPAGFACEFSYPEPMPLGDLRCGEGETDEYCGMGALLGQCVERQPAPCQGLDEWACIENQACEPVYEYAACDCIDCFCEYMIFAGCSERQIDPCFGAWLDNNGLCRAPDDGVYPQECCGQTGCLYDSECPQGFVCSFPEVDCFDGDRDCGMLGAGVCMPATSDCFDDSQCPAGFVCAFPVYDCAEGELDCGMLPGGGQCVPAGCAALSEAQCLQDAACEATYLDVVCPMNCAPDGTNCMCEPVFGGCVDAGTCWGAWVDQNGLCRAPNDGVYPAGCCGLSGCRADADCPNGYCEMFATCAGLDCPPPPEAQCVFQNCDDGSELVCDVFAIPSCGLGETLAVRDGCFACVDARTCEVVGDCGADGCLPPGER